MVRGEIIARAVVGSWTYYDENLKGGTLVFINVLCGRWFRLGYRDTGALMGAWAWVLLTGTWRVSGGRGGGGGGGGNQEVVPGVVQLLWTGRMTRSHWRSAWFGVETRSSFCPARQLWVVDCWRHGGEFVFSRELLQCEEFPILRKDNDVTHRALLTPRTFRQNVFASWLRVRSKFVQVVSL